MGCKNCGKSDRHYGGSGNSKKVVSPKQVSPFGQFLASKSFTYEQLKARLEEQQRTMDTIAEKALAEMTEPMKRVQVEMLVGVINCETASFANITPNQALYTLKKYLDRPDFEEIRKMYPSLKKQVNKKYQEMVSNKIELM